MLGLIPIHDENPARRRAVVTYLLIALNVLVFLVEPVATSIDGSPRNVAEACQQIAFFRKYAAIPRELTSGDQLPETAGPPTGPQSCQRVRPDYDKSPFVSVLWAMFLHGSWIHLLGNMLFLWIFGNNVEDRLGHVGYLLFYLACGYLATYAFALSQRGSTEPLVGASGAIAGVLGAYLVLFPAARITSLIPFLFFLPARLPAWLVLGSWFLLQWFYFQGAAMAEGSSVAYLAHVAGFAVGAIVMLVLGRGEPRRPTAPPYPYYR